VGSNVESKSPFGKSSPSFLSPPLTTMRSLLALTALTQLAIALPAQDQFPFLSSASSSPPFSLPLSSQADVTIHSHPSLPHHQVRLREPQGLCDPAVKSWSGYLDVAESDSSPSRHFFSWVFESRNDPKNDPVVLW